jgi:hypothetical protein
VFNLLRHFLFSALLLSVIANSNQEMPAASGLMADWGRLDVKLLCRWQCFIHMQQTHREKHCEPIDSGLYSFTINLSFFNRRTPHENAGFATTSSATGLGSHPALAGT